MRDALEIQAMLIRHEEAMKMRGQVDPIELLRMVVAPTDALRDASLMRARSEGVTSLARRIATKQPKPVPLRKVSTPSRRKVSTRQGRKRVLTLDEIIARA